MRYFMQLRCHHSSPAQDFGMNRLEKLLNTCNVIVDVDEDTPSDTSVLYSRIIDVGSPEWRLPPLGPKLLL